MSATEVEAAYARCEAITREQAANFYYGIRLLSRERRRAMCAVYAFARRIDDIGDGPLGAEEKVAALAAQERAVAALEGSPPPSGEDPVMVALADARARFPLPMDALAELIAGVRMDVEGVSYERFDDLLLYCRRVAGTIGRLCLAIFGLRERESSRAVLADSLAEDLGVALQLTNILRDLREDAAGGRVYLPREDLRAQGLPAAEGPAGAAALLDAIERAGAGDEQAARRLASLTRFEAARARRWFGRGMELAPMLDRRSAACVLAMAGIYRRVLERIDADPAAALAARVSLPAREKAWVALAGMAGAGP